MECMQKKKKDLICENGTSRFVMENTFTQLDFNFFFINVLLEKDFFFYECVVRKGMITHVQQVKKEQEWY